MGKKGTEREKRERREDRGLGYSQWLYPKPRGHLQGRCRRIRAWHSAAGEPANPATPPTSLGSPLLPPPGLQVE